MAALGVTDHSKKKIKSILACMFVLGTYVSGYESFFRAEPFVFSLPAVLRLAYWFRCCVETYFWFVCFVQVFCVCGVSFFWVLFSSRCDPIVHALFCFCVAGRCCRC